MLQYPKEQLSELYESLPEKLQEALYSDQNGKSIKEICGEKSITDDNTLFEINKYVGYVLFGLLPPDNLSSSLEKELKIKKEDAEYIGNQISRLVFLPIKDVLEPLYGIKIKVKEEKKDSVPIKKKEDIAEKSSEKNIYREPI